MSAQVLSAAERVVGKYRIIGQLGEGGQARVYLALMSGPASFNKLLVLKVLRDTGMEDPLFVNAFMQEARLAAQVNHPGIVQTYEVGEDRGRYYIAMEFVNGQSLRAIHRRLAPDKLPLHVHLGVIAEVARALHYTHTLKDYDGTPLNLVHRDVSPQNVMVSYEGAVKLLDFGIAKVSGNDELTREGMIKGKVAYMAPEQLRGGSIDHRADIFSLGVMIWQAVTGRSFSGPRDLPELTKMQHRLEGSEPRLAVAKPDAHPAVIALCDRALALNPDDRQSTAEELADQIEEYLAEHSGTAYLRELTRLLNTHFAADRRKAEATIDEQIRIAMSETSDPIAVQRVEVHAEDPTRTTAVEATATPPASSSFLRWAAAAAALVVLVAVAYVMRPTESTGAGAAEVAAAPVSAQPVLEQSAGADQVGTNPRAMPIREDVGTAPDDGARGAATVRVRVTVSPPDAQLELDGEPLPSPADVVRPRDGRTHILVATAPGHHPERRTISFESDIDITLSLRRARAQLSRRPEASAESAGAEQQASARHRASTSSSASAEDDQDRPRVLRPRLDREDPYQ